MAWYTDMIKALSAMETKVKDHVTIFTANETKNFAGRAFSVDHDFGVVIDGATVVIGFQTQANVLTAISRLRFMSDVASFKVETFEDADWSGGSNVDIAVNRNRNFLVGDLADRVKHDVTEATEGTSIDVDITSGDRKAGGAMTVVGEDNWILKPDTQYLVKFTNQDGAQSTGFCLFQVAGCITTLPEDYGNLTE